MAAKKKAAKKAKKKKPTVIAAAAAAAPGLTVPRTNVGATVQAMIVEGATQVLSEEQTTTTWLVTRLA